MRIISGKYKGRRIPVPGNFQGRPTTDYARESLFNVLQHHIGWDGAHILDLFAGTGAISLECISRGAEKVVAVEKSPVHIRAIKENFKTFEAEYAQAWRADVFSFIQKCQDSFHLIVADPPYDLKELTNLPELIVNSNLLKQDGWFVLEHPDRMDFSEIKGFNQHRRYGSVNFSFFLKE